MASRRYYTVYTQKRQRPDYSNFYFYSIKKTGRRKLMKRLPKFAGALMLLLSALCTTNPLAAQEAVEVSEATTTEAPVIFYERAEIVQELPDYSQVWLDGRVSFIGGELSTSERQYLFAVANEFLFIENEAAYHRAIADGHLVRLQHPGLTVAARRPYVLPATAAFIYRLTDDFNESGCTGLRVNDATRLVSERPRNGSVFSVHPAGMAADLRIINLSERCYQVLSHLLHQAEAEVRTDATREHYPPHYHIVVIPEERRLASDLVARYPREEPDGLDE